IYPPLSFTQPTVTIPPPPLPRCPSISSSSTHAPSFLPIPPLPTLKTLSFPHRPPLLPTHLVTLSLSLSLSLGDGCGWKSGISSAERKQGKIEKKGREI
ncbi:unnamed protein product, partial [Linum tenue]